MILIWKLLGLIFWFIIYFFYFFVIIIVMWLVCLLIGEVEFLVCGWNCFKVGFLLVKVLFIIKDVWFRLKLFLVFVIVDFKIFLMFEVVLFGVNFRIVNVLVMDLLWMVLSIRCILWDDIWIILVVVLVEVMFLVIN